MSWTVHMILLPLLFVTGALVGSFANVCIYRIPWEKSVIWPPSNCPRCLAFIAPRDNIPIVSWLALGGACRSCGARIAPRYALIELLVALLFVAVYAVDVMAEPELIYGGMIVLATARAIYHATLVALLVIATFIDYDYEIIPDAVTIPGMLIGLIIGTAVPEIRPEPAAAESALGGLWTGFEGLLVGGAVIYAVRLFGTALFRKEGMGLGDLTLVAMIGAFLGWQVVPLTLFLGAFLGLGHGLLRFVRIVADRLAGRRPMTSAIPFGPYLSLAALLLLLGWRWLWPGWLAGIFEAYGEVAGFVWESFWDLIASKF